MATRTALVHPKARQQSTQFHPLEFVVKEMDGNGRFNVTVASGQCAFAPAEGGAPADFETEAPVSERVLIPAWHPEIKAKMHVTVTQGTWKRIFEIEDAVPQGRGPEDTLLVVSTFQ